MTGLLSCGGGGGGGGGSAPPLDRVSPRLGSLMGRRVIWYVVYDAAYVR